MNYHEINREVMTDTLSLCQSNPVLRESIRKSIAGEKVIREEERLAVKQVKGHPTITLSPISTLAAAEKYKGEKVCVLNFANNHTPGGAPFSAGAQEETLCRSTTLYPCLLAKEEDFYERHRRDFENGTLDNYGNNDVIYTPDVVVFKTHESEPRLLPQSKWFKINVLSAAAPELRDGDNPVSTPIRGTMASRIRRILDVAWLEGNTCLILGAFGCGAFGNAPGLVANLMNMYVRLYPFKSVEFAIMSHQGEDKNYLAFQKVLSSDTSEK